MAAPIKVQAKFSPLISICYLCILCSLCSHAKVFNFKPEDILQVVSSSCLVALPESVNNTEAANLLSTLSDVSYATEPMVVVGRVDTSAFQWPNGNILELDDGSNSLTSNFNAPPVILLIKRVIKDRKCLLIPKNIILPKVLSYKLETKLNYEIKNVIEFINYNCDTFRKKDGSLSPQGLHRNYILENVFSALKVKDINSNSGLKITLNKNPSCESPVSTYFMQRHNKQVNLYCAKTLKTSFDILYSDRKQFKTQYCERISLPSPQEFLHNYVFRSKPVIIKGATQHWPAFKTWTNQYLRDRYGDKIVHIKITPSGEYEGVEKVQLWENRLNVKIPKEVLANLPYPDLVVVRPATMEIKFSEFLDIVEDVATKRVTNMSAYLEYSSINDYFPELREDFDEMSFFRNILELKHINMWLSDGNTVGKLHFDPFDNFMSQISGEKEFILYDPHDNERLYEAHIQEAILSYNKTTHAFSRLHLFDSTSMVMSPVDIEKPDLQRFPKFADTVPMSCKIKAGEVLFTPAFWWHEVRSSPNVTERRNLAINFWYEPFLQKEFPCPECGLDVNPRYFHLL